MSQFSPEGDKETLKNYLPNIPIDIYPVGRLDYDSEGLIVLTNDKKLNGRLLNPERNHQKTYWVQVEGIPNEDQLAQLRSGTEISINGVKHITKPAIVRLLSTAEIDSIGERNPPIRFRQNIPTTWIALTITEGKNRQVRKMTASVNLPTLRLIRNSIGNITIQDIPIGGYKIISAVETIDLFKTT